MNRTVPGDDRLPAQLLDAQVRRDGDAHHRGEGGGGQAAAALPLRAGAQAGPDGQRRVPCVRPGRPGGGRGRDVRDDAGGVHGHLLRLGVGVVGGSLWRRQEEERREETVTIISAARR